MKKKCINQISTIIILIFVFSLSLISCKNISKTDINDKDSLSGKISISGAFALYPLTVKWAEEYQKIHPKVTINVSAGGAGKGMTDALSGMVDLGMFSKEVCEEEIKKGAWYVAVAKDAVLATVNEKNPIINELKERGLKQSDFYEIFITSNYKKWGWLYKTSNNSPINVYTRSDACGAAEMWAKYLKNKKQEDIKGIGVNGDPGVAEAVRKDINGIGYNNIAYVYDIHTRKKYQGIDVVPIDINSNGKIDKEEMIYETLDDIMNAIRDGIYPSPPARALYFVSNGKPKKSIVNNFILWVLTDGQKYVNEAGYVKLPDQIVNNGINKIKN